MAFVREGTGVSVITEVYIWGKDAPSLRCAAVIGTDVSIKTNGLSRWDTGFSLAHVIGSAGVVVVARRPCWHLNVKAFARFRIASARYGAGAPVVFALLFNPLAQTTGTGISQCAGISIGAKDSILFWSKNAPEKRITNVFSAGRIILTKESSGP